MYVGFRRRWFYRRRATARSAAFILVELLTLMRSMADTPQRRRQYNEQRLFIRQPGTQPDDASVSR